MSCALRALRKAKSLIKEVTANSVLTFNAKVAGKVPLERDPDKKKKVAENSEKGEASSKAQAISDTKNTEENQHINGHEDNIKSNEADKIDNHKELGNALARDKTSTEPISQDDIVPKIISSYSLHDPRETNEMPADITDPNLNTKPVVHEKSAVLSFLGPDPNPPPPPLKPAPNQSVHNKNSSLPPPPPLITQAQKPPEKKNPHFFVCGFNCLFSTISASEFREHLTNFHSGEPYFPCYYCGHRAQNENDLVRHMSNHTHNNNKNSALFACGVDGCKYATNMLNDFINHMKEAHPEITTPHCQACGEVFPDVDMLKLHLEESTLHVINCPHCTSKVYI